MIVSLLVSVSLYKSYERRAKNIESQEKVTASTEWTKRAPPVSVIKL